MVEKTIVHFTINDILSFRNKAVNVSQHSLLFGCTATKYHMLLCNVVTLSHYQFYAQVHILLYDRISCEAIILFFKEKDLL